MADIADELRKNQAAWQKDFDERERDDNGTGETIKSVKATRCWQA
jgi:hypothetical protein